MNRMRTHEVPGAARPQAWTDLAELNRHLEHARVLRSQATAELLRAGFGALARGPRGLVAGSARWWRRHQTEAALMRCSDLVLADVGIEREDIPLVARGIDPRAELRPSRGVWRERPPMLTHAEALAMIWRGAGHGWSRHHPQTVADRA